MGWNGALRLNALVLRMGGNPWVSGLWPAFSISAQRWGQCLDGSIYLCGRVARGLVLIGLNTSCGLGWIRF